MTLVEKNLNTIRARLGGKSVLVVGITKGQPVERVREGLTAGLSALGNNYAQEGQLLVDMFPSCEWHFVGHIQSRKTKYLTRYSWIHSLDRIEIISNLNARLEAENKTIQGLVEINIGEESSKSGIAPQELAAFLEAAAPNKQIRLRGLMVMPPPLFPVEKRRCFFQRARELFQSINAPGWDTLSMGTSEDYSIAVEEGSTLVRLGTVLFGARA